MDDFYEYLNAHATDAEVKGYPMLIMGDFNGHLQGWYSDSTNSNGQALLDFADFWKLEILPNN